MDELQTFRKPFQIATRLLLMRWKLWSGIDEIQALNIGFDCFNTEICVSLLTDREPRLQREGASGLGASWPVASWRLSDISRTGRHCFPDAAALVTWMGQQARAITGSDAEMRAASERLNEAVKRFIFEAATSDDVLAELRSYPRHAVPLPIRVQWFQESGAPLDFQLV